MVPKRDTNNNLLIDQMIAFKIKKCFLSYAGPIFPQNMDYPSPIWFSKEGL